MHAFSTMANRESDLALQRRLVERLRQLSSRFRELHQRGVAALEARDYRALSDVIALERTLIRRHSALVQRHREMFQQRIAHLPRWRRASRPS